MAELLEVSISWNRLIDDKTSKNGRCFRVILEHLVKEWILLMIFETTVELSTGYSVAAAGN